MTKYVRFPLNVDAIFTSDGRIKPRKIIIKEGSYPIDKIVGIKRYCPKTVPCIAPYEYTVMVAGTEKKLYFEPHSNMWFSIKEIKGSI